MASFNQEVTLAEEVVVTMEVIQQTKNFTPFAHHIVFHIIMINPNAVKVSGEPMIQRAVLKRTMVHAEMDSFSVKVLNVEWIEKVKKCSRVNALLIHILMTNLNAES